MTTLDIAQIGFLVVVVALGLGLIIHTLAKEKKKRLSFTHGALLLRNIKRIMLR
ncbi:MAG: hypothetical protein SO164_07680 [Campylobacter sp.]|nr:hypothetical protein [Campylobacter sp.]